MKQQARVVIIGAGIVGVSVAYHLAQMGNRDILVLDKGDLDVNDGSSAHAPGGLRVLTPSDFFTRLGWASRAVYDQLPLAQAGQEHFFRTGLLQVASTRERFDHYRRLEEKGLALGVASALYSPREVAARVPIIDPATITGGLWIPGAGVIKTSLIATSMRRLAEATGGASFRGWTEVTQVLAEGGRVRAVLTSNPELPRVDCEQVVLCNNIWAPLLCEALGVPMPLFPGQHQYIFTQPVPALVDLGLAEREVSLPVVTMDDISIYFRQHHDRLGIGSYHHQAMLVDPQRLGQKAEVPFTPADFTTAWKLMRGHLPPLRKTQVSHGFNGMFSFTVDGWPIMGESQVKGFWTAIGAWLSFASEVGRVMARWMVDGDPGMDLRYSDINRFYPYHSNREFLTRQSKYYYEIGFDVVHPSQVASTVRDLRRSPYHERLKALGAEFTAIAGIETPLWYQANARLLKDYRPRIPRRTRWDAQYWSPIQGAEHLALRENVALVDWTAGIGPVEVSGPGAAAYLNYLCSNDVDRPVGTVTYTLWLTPKGGIKRDVTIARLGPERFWVLTGKGNLPAELTWMRRWAPQDRSVTITDLSSAYVGLALWGPNSRRVLQKITDAHLGNSAFPYYAVREIGVGLVPAVAVRLSYAGELGWEIYAPADYGVRLWDTLWEAGREFDMAACGMGALLSLRLEKGYRLWGTDIHTEYNPYEAGLGRFVSFDKGDFVGRAAAQAAQAAPLARRLCCLTFSDPRAIMYGFEPVFSDGNVIGHITSGNYGYSVGKFIAYAYLPAEHATVGTKIKVRYTGRYFDGKVAREPLSDRGMKRVRA